MPAEVMHSTEACRLIRLLEELLEQPVVAVVTQESTQQLAFVTPAGYARKSLRVLLRTIGAAAHDASKSL